MNLSRIPFSFVCGQLEISWKDALWGYEHSLFSWSDVVEMATNRLLIGSNSHMEAQLSCLGKSDCQNIGELLRLISSSEPEALEGLSEKKWLFLSLAWLYENKDKAPDPLSEIDMIYAEFDYPEEIEGFVSYMPPTDGYDPSQHDSEENTGRLFSKWKRYLIDAKETLANTKNIDSKFDK